jgi:hypothetical protein
MADWVKELFNYGTLGMLVAGLVWIIYAKIIPWGERYITSTETFLRAMDARDQKQQDICGVHADNLGKIADLTDKQTTLIQGTHESIKALVTRSEHPDAPFSTVKTNADIARMKRAAIKACELCRKVADKEFPNSSPDVDRHCDEIERIISEA